MQINNDYTIPVSDNRKTTLNDLVTEGELATEIRDVLSSAKFKKSFRR